MKKLIVETLFMNPIIKDTDAGLISQSISIAKVENKVSFIMSKLFRNYPQAFVRIRLTQKEVKEIIGALQEALKDNPRDFAV